MKKALIGTTVAVMALGAAMVFGQSAPQARRGTAETRLIGVSLYDTGAKVVGIYGSPDEILALSESGGGAAGGGGGGAAGGGGRGGDSGGPADAQTGLSARPDNGFRGLVGDPFGSGQEWNQARRTPTGSESAGGGGGGGGGRGGAPGTGDAGGEAGRGGGGTATGSSGKVIYTRWVYKRNNSRYAFVFDKFNRVIQIEAIGMKNSSVKTRRGITFGSSFSSLIKAYNAPDSYEINGDNLVVRFLVRDRVAFRLSRLAKDKPQVVTGVVVAAGKT